IICRMGFASYFLIVWDFVRFALENGIPASARGSACAALVSYVLKLSHVDPLEYDLLFERFLDPSRAEAPDIDIDFSQDRRAQVVREVIDIARTLEGTNRNAGTHAAGVVIANGPLVDHVPLQRVLRKGDDGGKRGEAVMTTQWVMGDLEKIGLLKMDFLGLRTLTLLDNAVRLIEKTRGEKIDLHKLPLDDRATY